MPAVLAACVLAIYLPSLENGFIYDDEQVIVKARTPASLSDFGRIFAERHFPNLPYYRPVTRTTLLLQKAISPAAWTFHLANAGLMALAALLAYALLRLAPFGIGRWSAFFAAGLFGIHPVASSCVYPISSGRETLLPSVLTLWAVYAYLHGGSRWRSLAWAGFAAALFSKEQAIVAPLLFAAADLLGISPDPPNGFMAWVRRYWPAALTTAVFLAVRYALFGGTEYLPGNPAEMLRAPVYAVQTIFAPFFDLVYEPTSDIWFSVAHFALAGALLAGMIAVLRRNWVPSHRTVFFWVAWFGITLLPTANILRQETHFDERYVFLASLAVFALLAVATPGRWRYVPAGLMILAALVTLHRAQYFHDDIAFSTRWLRTNPASVNAHYDLAYALAKSGDAEGAARHYAEAVRLRPDYSYAHNNLGNALSSLGRVDEAIPEYETALRLNPDYAEAHNGLGLALAQKQQWSGAVRHFQAAVRIQPSLTAAWMNLGNASAAQGEFAPAIQCYAEATRLDPTLADAHNNWANALVASGKPAEAVAHYREALRLCPDYEEARRNLGIVEAEQQR